MQGTISIFNFIVFIFSVMVHEVAHGLAAEREGDPTARLLGRITLNPLKHIDWVGSVLLPLLLTITNAGFIIGWAKPVPYNANNLRQGNKSIAKVSIAGIVVNLGIAFLFGIIIRLLILIGSPNPATIQIASIIVLVNLVLALFNAIPLAPLDGFNFLQAVLPARALPVLRQIERFSLPLLLLFVIFGWKLVAPFALTLYTLFTGITL
jgi:Zn-dependent protease